MLQTADTELISLIISLDSGVNSSRCIEFSSQICVGNLTLIGSDNGLSPDWRQAIIWNNDGILLIGPLGRNFSEILIQIRTFSFKKMHLKSSSAKWRPLVSASKYWRTESSAVKMKDTSWIAVSKRQTYLRIECSYIVMLIWHHSSGCVARQQTLV